MPISPRLLNLARDSRLHLILTILCGFLAGILTILQARALAQIISGVFLGNATLAEAAMLLRFLLVIVFLRALLHWGSEISANAVAVRIKADLRRRLFAHIIELGPAYVRGERTGELSAVVVQGIEALDSYFRQYLPQLVLAGLIPLTILVFVFPLDPLSGVVFLLTAPLIPLFMILIGKATEVLTKRQWDTLSRLSAHFLDALQGLTTLRLLGQSKAYARTMAEASDRFRDTTLSVMRVAFLSALVLELVATISTAIVAVEVSLRLLYYKMTFTEAFFLILLAPEFYLPLRTLGLRFHAGMEGTSAARRIFAILDTPPSTIARGGIRHQEWAGMLPEFSTLEFQNVSFTYEPKEPYVIKDLNLHIQAGQRIALVGASGVGKSTLVQLALRFMEPNEGQIMLNGTPITPIDPQVWRRQIAWVPQRPFLFHDTLAANIRLGQPGATLDEVIAAAQAAHLHDFVMTLSAGYETVIGEGGARLSSGQRQRLALARALLKNAPLLILDEPTSHLDPETEALLEDATRRLMIGRTVITIAHRLNTIYTADQIMVMQDGRITEVGSHRELLERGGAYAELVHAHAYERAVPTSDQPPPLSTPVPEPYMGTSSRTFSEVVAGRSTPGRPWQRLLGFLHGSWGWIALSVLLGVCTIGSNIALLGTSAYLISAAALHPSIANLQIAIVGVRFFGLARGLCRYLERLVSHNVTFRVLARIRGWFYQAMEPLAPARLMQYRSGDLLSRVMADVDTLENFYVRVVSPPIVATLVSLGVAAFLWHDHPSLGIVLLGSLLAMGVLVPLLTEALSRKPGQEMVTRRAELHIQLADNIQGLADLVAFGREHERQQDMSTATRCHAQAQTRLAWITGFHSGLSILLPNLSMLLVIVLAIPLVRTGETPGVLLASLAWVTLASFEAVTPLALAAQSLSSSYQAARRLFGIVDVSPVVTDPIKPLTLSHACALSVRDLRFSYTPDEPPALDGVSFDLPEKGSLAIVGPSGAGKTTLVQLLLRFWDYQEGRIYLGGHELRRFAQEDIRRQISVVSQNSYFFNDTLRQNLLLARPDASDEEMVEAADRARIHGFIARLPKGYDTSIGEHGLHLSSGERQRLAIARALLKNAPLLILDEPTANLDPLTESQILETLLELMRHRTVLHITHRIVSLEHFDEILVLDHGRIRERGRHAVLLEMNGLYRHLWDIQNSIYQES